MRRQFWFGLSALAWTLTIYIALPVSARLYVFLTQNTPLDFLIKFAFSVVALALFLILRKTALVSRKPFSIHFILALFLFFFALSSARDLEDLIHFVQYTILSSLIYGTLFVGGREGKACFMAFLLTFLVGWLDEMLQPLVPGRGFEWHDLLTNSLAALFGLIFSGIVSRAGAYDKDVYVKEV